MSDLDKSGMENVCRDLNKALQGLLSWKWDGRFETVLAEFAVKKKDGVRAVLDRYFPNSWGGSTIGNAPGPVQAVNGRLGGLREGQLLFATDPNDGAFLFCAWWPWGDGKTISIRIAPSYQNLAPAEGPEKSRLLKGWFGI